MKYEFDTPNSINTIFDSNYDRSLLNPVRKEGNIYHAYSQVHTPWEKISRTAFIRTMVALKDLRDAAHTSFEKAFVETEWFKRNHDLPTIITRDNQSDTLFLVYIPVTTIIDPKERSTLTEMRKYKDVNIIKVYQTDPWTSAGCRIVLNGALKRRFKIEDLRRAVRKTMQQKSFTVRSVPQKDGMTIINIVDDMGPITSDKMDRVTEILDMLTSFFNEDMIMKLSKVIAVHNGVEVEV